MTNHILQVFSISLRERTDDQIEAEVSSQLRTVPDGHEAERSHENLQIGGFHIRFLLFWDRDIPLLDYFSAGVAN